MNNFDVLVLTVIALTGGIISGYLMTQTPLGYQLRGASVEYIDHSLQRYIGAIVPVVFFHPKTATVEADQGRLKVTYYTDTTSLESENQPPSDGFTVYIGKEHLGPNESLERKIAFARQYAEQTGLETRELRTFSHGAYSTVGFIAEEGQHTTHGYVFLKVDDRVVLTATYTIEDQTQQDLQEVVYMLISSIRLRQ